MDADAVVVVVVMTLSGLFVGFLGRRIRQGDLHLIAGYRGEENVDEVRLARSMGAVAYAVAALTVAAGVAYPLLGVGPDGQLHYWGAYTLGVCLLAGYAQFVGRAAREAAE